MRPINISFKFTLKYIIRKFKSLENNRVFGNSNVHICFGLLLKSFGLVVGD